MIWFDMATTPSLQQPEEFHLQRHPSNMQNHQQQPAGMIPSSVPVAQGQRVGTTEDPLLKNKTVVFGLGVAEMVMGGLSVLLTIAALAVTDRIRSMFDDYKTNFLSFVYVSPGIWGGIFVIFNGILAVRIKKMPLRRMYIANMIMAIIAACVTFSSTVISGIAAGFSTDSSTLVGIHVMVAILNSSSTIVVIINAVFCCCGVCYKKNAPFTQRVMHAPAQSNIVYSQQPQYVQTPDGQLMLAYVQQVPVQGYQQSSGLSLAVHPRHQVRPTPIAQPPSYVLSDPNASHDPN